MFFTIITVTFNAENLIDKTISSVLSQSFGYYEVVIIDGKSSDSTVEKINAYKSAFEGKGIQLHIISEPDSGIFDAMNKGIGLAAGEWIIYLNAGDSLCDSFVLERIYGELSSKKTESAIIPDAVFGDSIYIINGEQIHVKAKNIEGIIKGPVFCHQSVVAKKELYSELKYNTDYKRAADYDMFLRAYLMGKNIYHIPMYISYYLDGGISAEDGGARTLEEITRIRVNNGIINDREAKRELRTIPRRRLLSFIKRCIPKSLLKKYYHRKYEHGEY